MKKPFYIEVPYRDPALLFTPHATKPFAQFLDSSMFDTEQGRYSFIVLDAQETFQNEDGIFETIKQKLATLDIKRHDDLPPFQGGFLGYFSYELLHQIERVPALPKDRFDVNDVCLGFYDSVCAFDHKLKKTWAFSLTSEDNAANLRDELFNTVHAPVPYHPLQPDWQGDFTRKEFEASVQQVIDYIHAGDIFQANLTQRFYATLPDSFDHFAFYANLRQINPAPFSAYLNFGDVSVACSSPERFLKVLDGHVETRPIKGTRPRLADRTKDREIGDQLAKSIKDRAENTMIVDLLRNDLSKVCRPHTVEVPELCGVHSFASVHHLVSTVTGELEQDKDVIDLLQACFPGGSITGAPKVRAMEIISELEKAPRGVYCGAIGYIGADGTMDTNIVIRTLVFKNNQVCAQVGGGIVADSIPADEYEETQTKAKALFEAFCKVAPI